MTDTYEFNGRIQAINSVTIVARVTAFLEQQLFAEGTDVKKGDLLYTLERPPFQAAVDVQNAAIARAARRTREHQYRALAQAESAGEKCW